MKYALYFMGKPFPMNEMEDMPYFMNDESWYEFDFEKRIFVLTEKASEKAKESYEEYLKHRAD